MNEAAIVQMLRGIREVEVADEFVEHDAFAEDLPDGEAIVRRHAHEPGKRRVDPAENNLQRDWSVWTPIPPSAKADQIIRQRHDGDERDEHGDDVDRKHHAVARAAAEGVNGIGRGARHGGGGARRPFRFFRFPAA